VRLVRNFDALPVAEANRVHCLRQIARALGKLKHKNQ
jgi:hypothetical protein